MSEKAEKMVVRKVTGDDRYREKMIVYSRSGCNLKNVNIYCFA